MGAQYDPWDPDVMADPYPHYERLRADGGVAELADLEMWVLSSHAFVSAALRDHRTFSSIGGVSRLPAGDELAGWISEDPPSHTATRAVAAPVFTRSAMTRHAGAVEAAADATVDRFVTAGGGDVVTELANPIAVAALCEILGVPNEWSDEMTRMSEVTFVTISARDVEGRPAVTEELQFAVGVPLSGVIEARRKAGDPVDAGASVVEAVIAHAGEYAGFTTLNGFGRAAYVTTLVSPGVETTTTMIANAVELAARFPDAWAALRAGAVDAAAFVAEVLRYESPVQGFFRAVTTPVELGAVTVPAGARVLCLYGSANRDEAVFGADAASFRPGRADAGRHLAYGAGIHRCIGAWLADVEGRTAIDALARRVEGFEVLEALRRTDMAQLRAWESLRVTV